LARRQEGVIVVKNQTQSVAAPTAAPLTVAPMTAAPMTAAPMTAAPMTVAPMTVAPISAHPAAASSRRTVGFSGRLMARPAAGATAQINGQVSFANANDVFIKVWAPPPRRESL
jgi:hypothetical protein